jgi:hypothetical protein
VPARGERTIYLFRGGSAAVAGRRDERRKREAMNQISPRWEPRRVPPVEVELLGSAVFVFSEYLAELEAERSAVEPEDEADEDGEDEETVPIDTRAVLDRLAEELATDPKTTLTLYMRSTALFRLLGSSPRLAEIATEPGVGGLTEEALAAAARLPLHADAEAESVGDFDPREFREALDLA